MKNRMNELELLIQQQEQELQALRRALRDAQFPMHPPLPDEERRSLPERVLVVGNVCTIASRSLEHQGGSIRVYTENQTIPESAVEQADEVWFSPTYCTHPSFRTVLGWCRAHDVRVVYFSCNRERDALHELYEKR